MDMDYFELMEHYIEHYGGVLLFILTMEILFSLLRARLKERVFVLWANCAVIGILYFLLVVYRTTQECGCMSITEPLVNMVHTGVLLGVILYHVILFFLVAKRII